MKDYIAADIASRINEIAKDDGVHALANYKPEIQPRNMKCIDIELRYKNYYFVERLNTSMNIEDKDVDQVAGCLLKDLFSDYFDSKLGLVT